MKPVTLDQIGIEAHERYAKDQDVLDASFIKGAAPHFEILGTSAIFSSEWDKLFEYSQRNHPWAAFAPPPLFALLQRRRFFSFSIIPSLDGFSQDEESSGGQDDENEDDQPDAFAEEKERLMNVNVDQQSHEKERSILFNLFDSMEHLNELLKEIHSKKLQYQKG